LFQQLLSWGDFTAYNFVAFINLALNLLNSINTSSTKPALIETSPAASTVTSSARPPTASAALPLPCL
jgi:hypothetical protein